MRDKKLGRTLTRREFLTVSGVGVAGASLLAGCELRGLLPRPPDKTPSADANVVLIILDSLRKDHVGAYGNDWIETPNLDALAGESLRFSQGLPRIRADHLREEGDTHGAQDLAFYRLAAL